MVPFPKLGKLDLKLPKLSQEKRVARFLGSAIAERMKNALSWEEMLVNTDLTAEEEDAEDNQVGQNYTKCSIVHLPSFLWLKGTLQRDIAAIGVPVSLDRLPWVSQLSLKKQLLPF